MNSQDIKSKLEAKFGVFKDKITTPRANRVFADLALGEDFEPILKYIVTDLGFDNLLLITGLDERETFGVIYHIVNKDNIVLNLKTHVTRENPVVKSIIDTFRNSELYERELIDLFGMKVDGLPEGRRYPLPDDWPAGQYPLRKDWSHLPGEEPEQSNNEVPVKKDEEGK
ncbi:MAG: NADH-quinone oxidoreductase subunit C [Elusimicrobiota bacterium]